MPRSFRNLNKPAIIAWLFFLLIASGQVQARTWWQIEVKGIPLEAEIVKTDLEQQIGLGNRFSLPNGQSMLFIYDEPGTRIFWMKRMNFPIDIIWFQHNAAVLIEQNVPFPQKGTPDINLERYGYGVEADMVLELPAGYVKKNQLALGDQLRIINRD